MLKKVVAIFLLIVFCITLISCGSNLKGVYYAGKRDSENSESLFCFQGHRHHLQGPCLLRLLGISLLTMRADSFLGGLDAWKIISLQRVPAVVRSVNCFERQCGLLLVDKNLDKDVTFGLLTSIEYELY